MIADLANLDLFLNNINYLTLGDFARIYGVECICAKSKTA